MLKLIKTSPIKEIRLCFASLIAVISISLFFNQAVHGQELSFDSVEVAPGLHMLFGVGGDNGVASALDILLEQVGEITDKPVDYLINTHIHGDHIGNNAAFGGEGARIISHDNLRESLVKSGKAGAAAIPVITFTEEMTLHINGDEATIFHVANAHTDGDAIIHFKNANVIHTGDVMFNGMFPFIDGNNGGALPGVIAALTKIESMANEQTKIMPGHGILAARDDVTKTIAMLTDSYELVDAMVKEGKTDEEIIAANPLSKYESFSWNFINTEKMTTQVLAAARSVPL